ncbi:hypothetical protein OSTOST_00078 [Ostertagia ostertagi]
MKKTNDCHHHIEYAQKRVRMDSQTPPKFKSTNKQYRTLKEAQHAIRRKRNLEIWWKCQKTTFTIQIPTLAELPRRRVVRHDPFQEVGLDLFGPLKSRTRRNRWKMCGCFLPAHDTERSTTRSLATAHLHFLLAEKIIDETTTVNPQAERKSRYIVWPTLASNG